MNFLTGAKEPEETEFNIAGKKLYEQKLASLKAQLAQQQKEEPGIKLRPVMDKLPDFFPTYVKQCELSAKTFMQCFEEEAKMQNEKDKMSCKMAVLECQTQLHGYVACMEKHHTREGKPWWQAW